MDEIVAKSSAFADDIIRNLIRREVRYSSLTREDGPPSEVVMRFVADRVIHAAYHEYQPELRAFLRGSKDGMTTIVDAIREECPGVIADMRVMDAHYEEKYAKQGTEAEHAGAPMTVAGW